MAMVSVAQPWFGAWVVALILWRAISLPVSNIVSY